MSGYFLLRGEIFQTYIQYSKHTNLIMIITCLNSQVSSRGTWPLNRHHAKQCANLRQRYDHIEEDHGRLLQIRCGGRLGTAAWKLPHTSQDPALTGPGKLMRNSVVFPFWSRNFETARGNPVQDRWKARICHRHKLAVYKLMMSFEEKPAGLA